MNDQPAKAPSWNFLLAALGVSASAALVGGALAAWLVSPSVGGLYAFVALWATGFFALSGLIFKAALFDRNKPLAILFGIGKLAWLALLFVVPYIFTIDDSERRAHGAAMFAGVSTPLFVLVLGGLHMLSKLRRGGSPYLAHSGPRARS